jgi:environmental stress-induced protein Ves
MQILLADSIPPTPWRNGGGQTRELFADPPGTGWRLRVSLADIERDGPFSPFPGVQRHFAVLEGEGVVLTLDGQEQQLTPASDPLAFDGVLAPDCRLIAGPTRDLNLMLRGRRGTLQPGRSGQAWTQFWRWRAVFCGGAAQLLLPGQPPHNLAARSLVVDLPPGPVTLLSPGALFWLGAD